MLLSRPDMYALHYYDTYLITIAAHQSYQLVSQLAYSLTYLLLYFLKSSWFLSQYTLAVSFVNQYRV